MLKIRRFVMVLRIGGEYHQPNPFISQFYINIIKNTYFRKSTKVIENGRDNWQLVYSSDPDDV